MNHERHEKHEIEPSKGQILVYQAKDDSIKLDVRLENETVWLTQDHMADLFGRSKKTISEHIRNIFKEGELDKNSVVRNFQTTASDGKNYDVRYYNLDVIISVGYRVKSQQGTQFRIWATQRLKDYIVKGVALDDERFKSGQSMRYFDELQERIREIRLSERVFYQKIKDIYTTSIDYNPKDKKTIEFFKFVQNKLLWAVSQQTAAELVHRRVDASLPLMGMRSYDKTTPVRKNDISIAKNYLGEAEIKLLGLLVEQYLAFAETMAQQHRPMYMKDWIQRLNAIIQLNDRELLTHAGKISQEMAKRRAELEYGKFREQQREIEKEQSLRELEADIKRLNHEKHEKNTGEAE